MAKSSVIIFSAVVVPLLTIAATVALAFVWTKPETRETLFFVNLGYGILLELIFFGFIAVVRAGRKKFTGAFYSIMGVCAVYYIASGAVLILFSALMPLKVYITALVILTLLWLIAGALIAETDARHKADEEITRGKNRKLMKKE